MNSGLIRRLAEADTHNHVHFLACGSEYDLSSERYDLYVLDAAGLDLAELPYQIGKVLPFPEWYGGNWAALNDSLASWEDWPEEPSGGVVLLVRGACKLTLEIGTLIEIWESVANEYWAPEGRPLHLVFEVPEH